MNASSNGRRIHLQSFVATLLLGCFNVLSKIIEDGLPSLALLFDRIFSFSVERGAHRNTICAIQELDSTSTVSEGILNQLVRDDFGIGSGEVKAEATVFGLHARVEGTANPQINSGLGCVPIIRRGIPLLDVVRCCTIAPNFSDRCIDDGFNGDFHGVTP